MKYTHKCWKKECLTLISVILRPFPLANYFTCKHESCSNQKQDISQIFVWWNLMEPPRWNFRKSFKTMNYEGQAKRLNQLNLKLIQTSIIQWSCERWNQTGDGERSKNAPGLDRLRPGLADKTVSGLYSHKTKGFFNRLSVTINLFSNVLEWDYAVSPLTKWWSRNQDWRQQMHVGL